MGYIKHHAIIVTSGFDDSIQRAHDKAVDIGCRVTNIVHGGSNGYMTFMIVPDGSKEGWEHSEDGNDRRELFKEWLNEKDLEWAEVSYGSDDAIAKITDSPWDANLSDVDKSSTLYKNYMRVVKKQAEEIAHRWEKAFNEQSYDYHGDMGAIYAIEQALRNNEYPPHWCGLHGFGHELTDTCPACYYESFNRKTPIK